MPDSRFVLQFDVKAEEASKEVKDFESTMTKSVQDIEGQTKTSNTNMKGSWTELNNAVSLASLAFSTVSTVVSQVVTPYAELEAAMSRVAATGGLSAAETEALTDSFRNLALELPVSVTELANVGREASALGIEGAESIAAFTETVAGLAIITGQSTDQSSQQLAILKNAFQLPVEDIDNLASALVSMSDVSAGSSQKIADISARVANLAVQIKLSAPEVIGLSSVLADVGLSSEIAGTSLNNVLAAMAKNVEATAETFNLSATQISVALRTDPLYALQLLLDEINKVNEVAGFEGVIQSLEEIGITGDGSARAMLTLANASQTTGGEASKLQKSIDLAKKSMEEGTAASDKLQKSLNNQLSEWQKLTNHINEIWIQAGKDSKGTTDSMLASMNAYAKEVIDLQQHQGTLTTLVMELTSAMFGFKASVDPVINATDKANASLLALDNNAKGALSVVNGMTESMKALSAAMSPAQQIVGTFALELEKMQTLGKATSVTYNQFTDSMKAFADAMAGANAQMKIHEAALKDLGVTTIPQAEKQYEALQNNLKNLEKAYVAGKVSPEEYHAAVDRAAKESTDLYRKMGLFVPEDFKKISDAAKESASIVEAAYTSAADVSTQAFDDFVKQQTKNLDTMMKQASAFEAYMAGLLQQNAEIVGAQVVESSSAAESGYNVTRQVYPTIVGTSAIPGSTSITYVVTDPLTGATATSTVSTMSPITPQQEQAEIDALVNQVEAASATAPQPRQHGGPVEAGQPYLVGEAGPELFVPRRSGRIVPMVPSFPSVTVMDPWENTLDKIIQQAADFQTHLAEISVRKLTTLEQSTKVVGAQVMATPFLSVIESSVRNLTTSAATAAPFPSITAQPSSPYAGPVEAGQPHIPDEGELFVPRTSGQTASKGAWGMGGTTVQITLNATYADRDSFDRFVRDIEKTMDKHNRLRVGV